MGKGYLIEHCAQEYSDREEKKLFAEYNSEILRTLTNNFISAFGGQTPFPKSWKEILEYKPETRSAQDIKNHVLEKLKAMGE